MVTLEDISPALFVNFRDENDEIVCSIDTFLTVWSSVGLRSDLGPVEAENGMGQAPVNAPGGQSGGTEPTTVGGFGVNINTAPAAVLKGLTDDRDVPLRFWDDVIEYRNLRDEEVGDEDEEPQYDEFGEELYPRQIFDDLEELSDVRGWSDFDTELKEQIKGLLTTRSNVFSIHITARRSTASDDSVDGMMSAEERARAEESSTSALLLTVRSVVWRHTVEDEMVITPILSWEVLSSVPFEVVDYPDDEY